MGQVGARPLTVVLVEFTPSGGLYQFAVQLGAALAARGHQVHLLTGPDPELVLPVPGLRVRPVLPTWHPMEDDPPPGWRRRARRAVRMLRYVAAYAVVDRVVRAERPDVVQWSNWRFPVDGPLVRWVGRRPVGAMLDLAHSPRPLNEQRTSGEVFKPVGRGRRLQGQAYARMDAVLVLGERSRADLLETWPMVRRAIVVPHGDESALRPEGPVAPAAECGPVVLFFGNLATYKGLDVLLEAWPAVRAAVPGARLVVAGAAAGDVDVPALSAQAAQAGGVDLRVGYVPLAGVAPLFTAARVVVAPYRYANASGVVSLAHTFARPVVASDVGDLSASVVPDRTGVLVPPEDPAALAAALVRVLQDDALATRLGAEGERRLGLDGAWDVVAAQVEQAYLSVLDGTSSG